MATIYKHTQFGTLLVTVIGILGSAVILFAPLPGTGYIIALLLLLALALFYSLTVEISDQYINLSFGIGVITKHFEIKDVRQVKPVKIRWYYGWGIRWIFDGWLYNVSGIDAVEIIMANGKKYVIGTDEPEQLVRAILSVSRISR
jgi:hypothetical protein